MMFLEEHNIKALKMLERNHLSIKIKEGSHFCSLMVIRIGANFLP